MQGCLCEFYIAKQVSDKEGLISLYRGLLSHMTHGWYCGASFKDLFFAEARPIKKGDLDEANGWVASADCFNVRIVDLTY